MTKGLTSKNERPIYQEGTEGWKLYALFDEKKPKNRQEAMAYAEAVGINKNSGSANFYQWKRPSIEQGPPYEVFTSKDEDYLAWLKNHPKGYVINSYIKPTANYLILHRAWCGLIQKTIGDAYLKVCSDNISGLRMWLNNNGFENFSKETHSCNIQNAINGNHPKIKQNTNMTTSILNPLNQILFGPPGTGKTFNTINKALEILDLDFLNANIQDRTALKNKFDDFVEAERIVFCTFHQSFSYEDFVEGLRAISDNGQIEYRVEQGVFKRVCESAVWSCDRDLISEALQQFIAQVTDKSIKLKMQGDKVIYVSHKSESNSFYCASEETPDLYIAQPKIEDVRKMLEGVSPVIYTPYVYVIGQSIKKQFFGDEIFSDKTTSTDDAGKIPYVLIIDEINRGNISKIFGELITLIEPSKRAGKDEALSVILPYSKESFSVPDNVYLIGTMNTADRSLASLDIALRRRFEFVEMPPRPDLLDNKIISGVNIGELLKVMNERIEILLGREHCLGHAYFMALPENASVEDLADIFRRQIIPLLQEYFFEDWQRISWVLNDPRKMLANRFLVQSQSNVLQLFGDEVGSALQENRWLISKEAFKRIEAYAGVINHEAKTTALVVGREVFFMGHTVRQLESGTIEILNGEEIITPVKPKLKEMAESLSIGILNSQDQPYNTRQLGKVIIDAVEALV